MYNTNKKQKMNDSKYDVNYKIVYKTSLKSNDY